MKAWTQPTQKEGDKHIMDMAVNHPNISADNVRKSKYYRLAIRTTILSDIITPDRKKVIPVILKGQ
eukprot:9653248-Ditylum_brightwellii.AAC.1